MNCPGCRNPIGEGPFPVVGVLKAYDLDRESVEKDGLFSLRMASEFVALAMVTCPACGWVFFMPADKSKSDSLPLQYSGFKE